MDSYEQGSTAVIEAVYTDGVGNLVTPINPTVTIVDALGATVVDAAVPTSVTVGVYSYSLALGPEAPLGVWVATWTGTIGGQPIVADDPFEVVVATLELLPGRPCQVWSGVVSCPADVESVDPTVVARALRIATDILWAASGRRFGICSTTVRPCRQEAWGDWASLGMTPWMPDSSYFGPASSGAWFLHPVGRFCGAGCGCSELEEIRLPNTPVRAVSEVLVDGVVLDPSAYRVDEYRWLVRLDGEKWPACFPAGTLVLTETGQRPIESIQPGERVLTHKNRWRTVTAAGQTGVEETVVVQGRGGPLRSTADHRVLAAEVATVHAFGTSTRKLGAPEWVRADELVGKCRATPKRVEALPIPLPEGWAPEEMNDAFWWFVGRWLGDGWTDGCSQRVVICCGDHEEDELGAALDAMGWRWVKSKSRGGPRWRCYSPSLWSWLRAEFGVGAHDKRMPSWVLGGPESLRRNLLAGYVAADGCVRAGTHGRPFTSVRTVSHQLALGTRLLASTLGHSATLYEGWANGPDGNGFGGERRWAYRVDWPEAGPGEPYAQSWADDDHLWGRVRRVTLDSGPVPVYDLEVEEDHSFVAGGFVVHNCQELGLDTTEEGTWSVTYTYGTPPPEGGVWAVERYACELAKSSVGFECELPERVQTITRQGITVSFLDPLEFLDQGRTGLPTVDAWIASVNKHGLARRSRVYRADMAPLGRRTGT